MTSAAELEALDQRDAFDAAPSDIGSDGRLIELVRAAGIGSAESRYLRDILTESVMGALKKMGPQGVLLTARQRGLGVHLAAPSSFGEDFPALCHLAVGAAWPHFLENHVMGNGWDASTGTSLRMFFINGVIDVFVDQYRRCYGTT